MVRIPVYQIRYADVYGNYVTIHTLSDKVRPPQACIAGCPDSYTSETFTVKMTLKDLETNLDNRFYRVSRSVLVNLTRISRVTKSEIRLNDGTAIPLPRGAYDGVNRAIINMR